MKIRSGFVSNSSSTSFAITNLSDEPKDLVDFVKENPQLLDDFNRQYYWNDYTFAELIQSAANRDEKWKPKESRIVIFGDEDGDVIGNVFDYILREGGKSFSFTWRFYESNR